MKNGSGAMGRSRALKDNSLMEKHVNQSKTVRTARIGLVFVGLGLLMAGSTPIAA